jgi:O-antigen/teichoic acid export membrane protein
MIEALIFSISAYLLTWPALLIILGLGVLAEHFDNTKTAVFLGLVAMTISYIMFSVPLSTLALGLLGYVIVGVLWSFWRYKRFVSIGVKSISKDSADRIITSRLRELSPEQNKGTLVFWIFMWPLSLISNLIGDFINITQKLVTEVFHKVYAKIFASYTKDII